jgi:chitodextrinase
MPAFNDLKKYIIYNFLLFLCAASLMAEGQVEFTSSNLPIVALDTHGQSIPDEPKITADMGIIYNGPGVRNNVADPFNNYNGKIGIEIRGSSSQMFPKKQYAVETRDVSGNDLDVPLLGFPEESDWILSAPYTDKTMMRDALTFYLSNAIGRYASRAMYCELVLNGVYEGVYILFEKVKRDKNRVNIAKLDSNEVSGNDLTGGYIVKIDKVEGAQTEGWYSDYPPFEDHGAMIYYQYHYPNPEDIVTQQKTYIRDLITGFESRMSRADFFDAQTGYPSLIEPESFVDQWILNEIGKNVDGYRLSAYLYKDQDSKDSRLHAGPSWDFNLAYGNADYYSGWMITGWQFQVNHLPEFQYDGFKVPFWWETLLTDSMFASLLTSRWRELRAAQLHTDFIYAYIDSIAALLDESQKRNFERWPILGQYVWPNYYIGTTYKSEVTWMKNWITNRMLWMDGHLLDTQNPLAPKKFATTSVNSSSVSLSWEPATDNLTFGGYDLYNGGRKLLTTTATKATVNNLDENTPYAFTIIARDLAGNISESNPQVSFTTDAFTSEDGMLASQTAAAPLIDGDADAVWNLANTSSLSNLISGAAPSATDLSAVFRTLWDRNNLYIYIQVEDDIRKRDSGASYSSDDGVEIYIDSDNSKNTTYGENDFKYRLLYNDPTVYERAHGAVNGVTFTLKERTDGYDVEVSLPWQTLKWTPSVNDLIGFEVELNDDDNGGSRDSKISWWGTQDIAYSNPSAFGVIKLKDQGAAIGYDKVYANLFELRQNYPNPFNPVTVIRYSLDVNSRVELTIYDILGRKITTLFSGLQTAGWREQTWDASGLPSGVYICRLRTDTGRNEMRRMALIK